MSIILDRILPKRLHCVVDLGTEVVKAVAILKQGDHFSLVGESKIFYTPHDVMWGGFSEIGDAKEVIGEAIELACRTRSPDELSCIIGPSLAMPCIVSQDFVREHPDKNIQEDEIQGYRKQLFSLCQELFRQKGIKGAFGEKSLSFLESLIQEYRVDGYSTEKPTGTKGKVLGISMIGLCAFETYEHIFKKLFEGFSKPRLFLEISLISFLLKTLFQDHRVVLCIDWGGLYTYFYLFRDGKIEWFHSFPEGGHHITSALARFLGVSFFEAEDLKRAHFKTLLQSNEQTVSQKTEQFFQNFFHDFFLRIQHELKLFLPQEHIISDIVWLGGATPPQKFQSQFLQLVRTDHLLVSQECVLHTVTPSLLPWEKVIDSQNPQDTLFALATQYISKSKIKN